jgi:hypothetical protein
MESNRSITPFSAASIIALSTGTVFSQAGADTVPAFSSKKSPVAIVMTCFHLFKGYNIEVHNGYSMYPTTLTRPGKYYDKNHDCGR